METLEQLTKDLAEFQKRLEALMQPEKTTPITGLLASAYYCKSNPEHLRWKIDIPKGMKKYIRPRIAAVPTRDEALQIINEIDTFIKTTKRNEHTTNS